MRSGKHNIEIENGSTFQLNLALTEDDGTNYNLNGYSVDMQIRNLNGTLVLDCSPYISVINGNEIDLNIPASATIDIADSDGEYQIEISSGSLEYSVMRGNVSFVKAIIR